MDFSEEVDFRHALEDARSPSDGVFRTPMNDWRSEFIHAFQSAPVFNFRSPTENGHVHRTPIEDQVRAQQAFMDYQSDQRGQPNHNFYSQQQQQQHYKHQQQKQPHHHHQQPQQQHAQSYPRYRSFPSPSISPSPSFTSHTTNISATSAFVVTPLFKTPKVPSSSLSTSTSTSSLHSSSGKKRQYSSSTFHETPLLSKQMSRFSITNAATSHEFFVTDLNVDNSSLSKNQANIHSHNHNNSLNKTPNHCTKNQDDENDDNNMMIESQDLFVSPLITATPYSASKYSSTSKTPTRIMECHQVFQTPVNMNFHSKKETLLCQTPQVDEQKVIVNQTTEQLMLAAKAAVDTKMGSMKKKKCQINNNNNNSRNNLSSNDAMTLEHSKVIDCESKPTIQTGGMIEGNRLFIENIGPSVITAPLSDQKEEDHFFDTRKKLFSLCSPGSNGMNNVCSPIIVKEKEKNFFKKYSLEPLNEEGAGPVANDREARSTNMTKRKQSRAVETLSAEMKSFAHRNVKRSSEHSYVTKSMRRRPEKGEMIDIMECSQTPLRVANEDSKNARKQQQQHQSHVQSNHNNSNNSNTIGQTEAGEHEGSFFDTPINAKTIQKQFFVPPPPLLSNNKNNNNKNNNNIQSVRGNKSKAEKINYDVHTSNAFANYSASKTKIKRSGHHHSFGPMVSSGNSALSMKSKKINSKKPSRRFSISSPAYFKETIMEPNTPASAFITPSSSPFAHSAFKQPDSVFQRTPLRNLTPKTNENSRRKASNNHQ